MARLFGWRRFTGLVLSLGAVVSTADMLAAPPHKPDLIADPNALAETWTVGIKYFAPGSCEIQEGCLGGAGYRKLLAFEVRTANVAQGAAVLGDPNGNPLFEFDTCHGHFHLDGFSDYDLVQAGANVVATGHKQGWCLQDTAHYLDESWVSPARAYTDCDNQGLSGGWYDSYPVGLPCQWIDVTGAPNGSYDLRVKVNAARSVVESSYSNNTSTVAVVIPDLAGNPDLTIDALLVASSLNIESRFVDPGDPGLQEGCLAGTGYRRLLTFASRVANVSQFDLVLGEPGSSPYFNFIPAHNHYHIDGFYDFSLIDASGNVVVSGQSASILPEDEAPYLSAAWVRPGPFYARNGLQRGWYTSYPASLPCHMLDITDVPDGDYTFRARVNPSGDIGETDLANNEVLLPLRVIGPLGGIAHRPDGTFVQGIPLQFVEPAPPQLASTGLQIYYDTQTCPSASYNLYYSARPPSSYAYDGASCNIGTGGSIEDTLPDPTPHGLLWFLIVGVNGTTEGGHGFDSAGRTRPLRGAHGSTGVRFCGLTQTIPRMGCAP